MSERASKHEKWHDDLPAHCTCHRAWADRGLVESTCWYHRAIDVVEELRHNGWTVERPEVNDD